MIQELLVALSLAGAGVFLLHRFVLQDWLRRRRPDVPLDSLVRKNRSPKSAPHKAQPPPSSGCH